MENMFDYIEKKKRRKRSHQMNFRINTIDQENLETALKHMDNNREYKYNPVTKTDVFIKGIEAYLKAHKLKIVKE